MEEKLKELYIREITQSKLDFDHDPEYQTYYTQVEEFWKGEDIPAPVLHLLDAGNFLTFAHGFRLGLALTRWARTG